MDIEYARVEVRTTDGRAYVIEPEPQAHAPRGEVTVRITVEVDETLCNNGELPQSLGFVHRASTGGDNPRFYGDAVRRAIREAVDKAMDGVAPVDLVDQMYARVGPQNVADGTPTPYPRPI